MAVGLVGWEPYRLPHVGAWWFLFLRLCPILTACFHFISSIATRIPIRHFRIILHISQGAAFFIFVYLVSYTSCVADDIHNQKPGTRLCSKNTRFTQIFEATLCITQHQTILGFLIIVSINGDAEGHVRTGVWTRRWAGTWTETVLWHLNIPGYDNINSRRALAMHCHRKQKSNL